MKSFRHLAFAAAGATAFVFFTSPVPADEKVEKPKESADPKMEEMMKKWEVFATPSAGHKALDGLAGEWEVDSRWWMAPDAPPMATKGTAKIHWVLGGRYLQEDFSGEFMQKPYQAIGTTAYDNFKRKYLSTWVDNMGTSIFYTEGVADDEGKVFTFMGKMDEPATGEKDKPTKCILRILSPDKHIFEIHDLTLGDKSKVAEMTYSRKQ